MLLNNEHLLNHIADFNRNLLSRPGLSLEERRRLLESIGVFSYLPKLSPKEAVSLLDNRPLIAVDGSYQTAGATYPYLLTLCQSYAKPFAPHLEEEGVVLQKIFSPLTEEDAALIEEGVEGGESPEAVFLRCTRKIMAELEIKAAKKALFTYRPSYLILDGGFVQYLLRTEDAWQDFACAAEEINCVVVGVIEEVSSRLIPSTLQSSRSQPFSSYDREFLYGTLKVGEYFELKEEEHAKYGFKTVFARPANYLQAIGYDFLPSQAKRVEKALQLLFALTPLHSRGIPLILDIVDRQVRITEGEIEQLLSAGLNPELKEKLLTPARRRREL